MKKFRAFTLAEVLITLGIIGVVAAMTMPTLINQTNGAQYKAAFKKSLSAISQAVTLNVALDDISFADTKAGEIGSVEPNANGEPTVASLLNSRMNIVDVKDIKPQGYDPIRAVSTYGLAGTTYLFFNDGSMFAILSGLPSGFGCEYGKKICIGYIDVNGLKGPNKEVRCDVETNTKSDTEHSGTITRNNTACTVSNPTDIYPVYYYDQTIVPATNAGRMVLYGK